jgi:hypothetical protein
MKTTTTKALLLWSIALIGLVCLYFMFSGKMEDALRLAFSSIKIRL